MRFRAKISNIEKKYEQNFQGGSSECESFVKVDRTYGNPQREHSPGKDIKMGMREGEGFLPGKTGLGWTLEDLNCQMQSVWYPNGRKTLLKDKSQGLVQGDKSCGCAG